MSTALAELRAGTVGPLFTTELRRTIRAVGVARNFPPPDGFGRWDADAVGSAASEFMSDAQTPRRLADLAVHCASLDALRARLQGTVRNFLADLGRRTPLGKLVVRINDVLGGEPGFVRVGGRWALVRGPQGAGNEDPDALARAVARRDVVVPAWGHDAKRSAPAADRATIVDLCSVLLEAAGGALAARTMARAIGARLGIGQAPLSLEVSALDPPSGADPASEATRARRAAEVLAELNDRERLSVAYPELAVRQLVPLLGVSSSQCHVVRGRAAEVIRLELVDDDDAEGIALVVMQLARAWAAGEAGGGAAAGGAAGVVDNARPSDVLVAR